LSLKVTEPTLKAKKQNLGQTPPSQLQVY